MSTLQAKVIQNVSHLPVPPKYDDLPDMIQSHNTSRVEGDLEVMCKLDSTVMKSIGIRGRGDSASKRDLYKESPQRTEHNDGMQRREEAKEAYQLVPIAILTRFGEFGEFMD